MNGHEKQEFNKSMSHSQNINSMTFQMANILYRACPKIEEEKFW